MNENQNSSANIGSGENKTGEQKQESQERVYEFTSDLNISPVKNPDQEAQPGKEIPPEEKPATPLQDAVAGINISPNKIKLDVQVPSYGTPEPDKEKALRTYESDIAEYMARHNTSTAGVAVAESERREAAKKMLLESQKQKESSSVSPLSLQATKDKEYKKQKGEEKIKEEEKTPSITAIPQSYTIDRIETPQPIQKIEQPEEVQPSRIAPPNYAEDVNEMPRHSGKKLFFLLLSMIFVLGGIIVAYYLYSISALAQKVPAPQVANVHNSLITPDSQVTIAIDGLSAKQIKDKIQTEVAKSQTPNTIKEIILSQKKTNNYVPVTGPEIINTMGIIMPDELKRSLTSDWMLGVYSDPNGNKDVFVIFTQNFFQNAFAGMLSWENSMLNNLNAYIYLPPATQTSTSTSSNSNANQSILQGHFIDGLVSNKDTREFKTDSGSIILLYSFVDNQKLVITSQESTLKEIVARLENQSFIR